MYTLRLQNFLSWKRARNSAMASNSLGSIFRITTWGESHGPAIGVVIDGCPAGLPLSCEEIDEALALRAPGKNPYTTPRKESDQVEILSGLFEGKTTGAPLSFVIRNLDHDSSKYDPIKDLIRPGHANYTYLQKYGLFDYRGGGRSSARETAARVAAGAVAKKILMLLEVNIVAYLEAVGEVRAFAVPEDQDELRRLTLSSPLFCPDEEAARLMMASLDEVKAQGDSLGGVVAFRTSRLPVGLGDPVYAKLEASLAFAMMSLPATKGFEIGSGFSAAAMKGSEHNDGYAMKDGKIEARTNHAGGLLGGISTGEPLYGRVAFKPTSSIMLPQKSVTLKGEETTFQLPSGSRHDPCVAIRAVPIVEAMVALVLVDAWLMDRLARL